VRKKREEKGQAWDTRLSGREGKKKEKEGSKRGREVWNSNTLGGKEKREKGDRQDKIR